MARFKMVGGQLTQADKSKPLNGPDGKPTGRFATKTFTAKEGAPVHVESDVDLVARFGSQFEYATDDGSGAARIAQLEKELSDLRARTGTPNTAAPETALANPSFAPGGQVSSGFQANSGPLNPDDAERAGVSGLAGAAAPAAKQAAVAPRNLDAEYGDLEKMTVADLRELAESEEIELHGATNKADIIRAIRAAK